MKTNKFKRKLRVITEPSQQQSTLRSNQPNTQLNYRRHPHLLKETIIQMPSGVRKPGGSEMIYLDQYDYRTGKQSLDSNRMYKIRSIATIDHNSKNSASNSSLHYKPNNRYGSRRQQEDTGSQQKNPVQGKKKNRIQQIYQAYIPGKSLSKDKFIGRSLIQSRQERQKKKDNIDKKIQTVKNSFIDMKNKISHIKQEEKIMSKPIQITRLITKNRQSSARIIFKCIKNIIVNSESIFFDSVNAHYF